MNCQDISLAMDDRDIGALNEAQRREFDAHLEACPDCARDWDLHVRLAATRTPAMPTNLQSRIEMSWPVRGGAAGRRTSRRLVVIGSVVLAAAAAMLTAHLMQESAPAAAPATVSAPPIAPAAQLPAPEPVKVVASAALAATPPAQPPDKEEASPPAQPTPLPAARTVRVLPLQNQATGAATAAVETFFTTFLANLRGNNEIAVIAPDQPEPAGVAAPKLQIRVRGYGPAPEGKFTMEIRNENLQPDGSYRIELVVYPTVDMAAACAGTPPFDTMESCHSPLHVAGALARSVGATLLRSDPALQRDPQARLLDRSLSQGDRLKALTELNDKPNDPAVVLGAADLAKTGSDPKLRAFTWRAMVNVRNPELVAPVVEAMVRDPDADVRLQAMIVAMGFAEDARVRDGFATIAQSDPRPMVRALGQRYVMGEESWKKYMASSLKDTSRPDTERVEALIFELNRPVPMDLQGFLQDNDALPALRDLLPGLPTNSPAGNQPLLLLSRLAQIDDPAITDLVLKGLEKQKSTFALSILRTLFGKHSDDPRVRAALEKIATEDPDPDVRKFVADLLRKP
jgi:hypothetical protein